MCVCVLVNLSQKLRPYGAIQIRLLLLFFDPGTQFPGNEKITLCNTKKYKNQAGMNLTPFPSQNSHAVRWHCTAESERRVAEIIIIITFTSGSIDPRG